MTTVAHVFLEDDPKDQLEHYTNWLGEVGVQLGHDCGCGADMVCMGPGHYAIWHLKMWASSECHPEA
jgi:hypothetical protein